MADGDPQCRLCKGEGRFFQNPTGDHDGTSWLSCPVCQTDRLRQESDDIGVPLHEDRLQALIETYRI